MTTSTAPADMNVSRSPEEEFDQPVSVDEEDFMVLEDGEDEPDFMSLEDGDGGQDSEPTGSQVAPLTLAPPARRETGSLDPLQIYLQEIKKFRALEPDEEFSLARR